MAALLCLLLVLTSCSPAARSGRAQRPAPGAAGPTGAGAPLQEVAPPGAVPQLLQALGERHPKVEILAPRDQALLPAGPWTLQLALKDWPLVDAGPLGLGPHLVVQLDRQPPQPITELQVSMPALSPGSHRLTVYAALPWGEAIKAPGASQQIRLHRVAVDPLALPAPGAPQLIPVSPIEVSQGQPVLLDWLLLHAPLQHLHEGDIRWRLRVSVNGNSVLVDRPRALWLSGWRPGSNALLLELLDGQGEPLAPPFNSAVAEVLISPQAPRQPWRQERLTAGQLAALLGEPPPAPQEPAIPSSSPAPVSTTDSGSGSAAGAPAQQSTPSTLGSSQDSAPQASGDAALQPSPDQDGVSAPAPSGSAPSGAGTAEPPRGASTPSSSSELKPPSRAVQPPETRASTAPPAGPAGAPPAAAPLERPEGPPTPQAPAESPAKPPAPPPAADRASARSLVNPDGTLIRDPAGGPLARLRQSLGR